MHRAASAFLPLPQLPFTRRRAYSQYHTSIAAINGPGGLPNARDLATASPKVRRGKIFRGATPAILPSKAHPDALHFLRTTRTLLDLRSRDERKTDTMKHVISACGHDFVERERHIGLLNKRKVVWGLARVLPREQVRELAMRVVRHPTRARKGIVNKMDQGGLILLNKVLVEAGARQIGRAMNVVTCGASKESEEEDGEGRVYFYCSAGKDRTGLLAALILRLLEVNEDDVIRDYARSQETWLNGPRKLRENYCARLEDAGLTPMNWLGAPPEVMEETLRYIKRRYGGIEDYMVHCGFEEERMNALREVMAPL